MFSLCPRPDITHKRLMCRIAHSVVGVQPRPCGQRKSGVGKSLLHGDEVAGVHFARSAPTHARMARAAAVKRQFSRRFQREIAIRAQQHRAFRRQCAQCFQMFDLVCVAFHAASAPLIILPTV